MEQTLCLGCMGEKSSRFCPHCGFDGETRNDPHQLPLGTVLKDQYIVGRVLGQGGFGITYLGYDRNLRMKVAIKEYYPRGVVMRDNSRTTQVTSVEGQTRSSFEANLRRFLREAQSLSRLGDAKEIVQVRNFFPENGTAYIIMEYIQGTTLSEHIARSGVLPPEQAMVIFGAVMEGLQKVHRAGLIHRDISPDNIMLLPEGGVKLLDFGAVRDYHSELSQSTQAIVKPGFAPAEQYRATAQLGPQTDLYALCATMFYCMTGLLPQEAPERLLSGADFPWEQITGLTPVQTAALKKGSAPYAQDRYPGVLEFRQALEAAPVQENQPPEPEKKPAKSRRRWLVPVIAAAAVLAAAGTLMLLLRQPGEIRPQPEIQTQQTVQTLPPEPENTEPPQPEETLPPETQPAETQPEQPPEDPAYTMFTVGVHSTDYPCWIEYTGDGMVVTGPGLEITVTGRHVSATVSGLMNQDSYGCNQPESEQYTVEYNWGLYMEGLFETYLMETEHAKQSWGSPEEKTIQQMEHILRLAEGSTYWFLSYPDPQGVTWDAESITWEFDVPQTPSDSGKVPEFDCGDFTSFRFEWVESATGTKVERTYVPQEGTPPETFRYTGASDSGYHWDSYPLTFARDDAALLSGEDLSIRLDGDVLEITVENIWVGDRLISDNPPEYNPGTVHIDIYWHIQLEGEAGSFFAAVQHPSDNSGRQENVSMADMDSICMLRDPQGTMLELQQDLLFTGEDFTLTFRIVLEEAETMLRLMESAGSVEVTAMIPCQDLWVSRTYVPEG